MRVPFTISVPTGYTVTDARLRVFGDNVNKWYVNGTSFGSGHWREHSIDPNLLYLNGGVNVLAGSVYNDGSCGGCNPFGMHYILDVYFEDADEEVTVNITNPEGDPVARPMGGATWHSFLGWVLNPFYDAWGTHSSYNAAPPDLGDADYNGAYVSLQSNDVPMWGQSDISSNGGTGTTFHDDGIAYFGWSGGTTADESVDLVVATETPSPTPTNTPSPTPTNTPTPTPTSTPYLQINVENPQGTPVAIEEIAAGDSNGEEICSDCPALERETGTLTARIFAQIRRLANQMLWGWSTTADNASLTNNGQEHQVEIDNWNTGGEAVNFVVVTLTPTPRPRDIPPHNFELDHVSVYPDDFCTYIVGGVYADDHALEDVWVRGVITTTQGRVRDVAATAARRYIPKGDGSCFKLTLCDLEPGETVADYELSLDAVAGYRAYPYVRAYATEIEDIGSGYAHAGGIVWVDQTSTYPTADNVSVVLWGWNAGTHQVTSCDAVGIGHLEQEDEPTPWNAYIRSANTYYYRTTASPH